MPKKEIPIDLRARVCFFSTMLAGGTFHVDRYKYQHERLRSLTKGLMKKGFVKATRDGRFYVYEIVAEHKSEFVQLIQDNYHVRNYINPKLLHLPQPK